MQFLLFFHSNLCDGFHISDKTIQVLTVRPLSRFVCHYSTLSKHTFFTWFPSCIQGSDYEGSPYVQTPSKRTYSTIAPSFTSLLISSRNSISEYGSMFKTRPRTSRMQYSGSTLFIDISQSVSRAMMHNWMKLAII